MSRQHLKRLTRSMSAFAALAAIAVIAPSSAMAVPAAPENTNRPAQVTLSGEPAGAFTNQNSFTIGLSTESTSLLKCREGLAARTNDVAWSNCQGAVLGNRTLTLNNLADGSYYWDIWAINAAYYQYLAQISGNTGLALGQSRQLDFTVDTIAPDAPALTPDVAGNSVTQSTSQSIAISGEQYATFVCSVDGGDFAPCSSPLSLSSLGDGYHTVSVAQTDRATNKSSNSFVSWTVDTVAPDAPQLSKAPSGSTNDTGASISFDGEGTFTCSVDGGAYEPCTSPQALSGLADGPHSLSVKATDDAGNTSEAASASWTVDTVAPDAPVLHDVPSSLTDNGGAQISFTAEQGISLKCSVDGGEYVPCISPQDWTGSGDGPHSLSVIAVDAAGNESQPASASWTVDTIAPAKPVLGDLTNSNFKSNINDQSFSITPSEDGGRVECKLGEGPWEPCFDRTKYDAQNIADGHYVVRVRQIDAAGNESETATTADWVIDTVAPDAPVIEGAPFIYSKTHSNSISFSGEAGATFECSVDSSAWAPCSSPLELNNVADGNHSVNIRATDSASNVSQQASTSLIVDTVGAVVEVTGAPSGISTSGDASISLSSENGATFECKIDNGAWATCSSPVALNGLADGAHSISVRATDSYGNTGAVVKKSWTVRKPFFPVDFTRGTTVSKVGKGTPWVLSLGVTTHNGDTRGGAYALTVQVSSSVVKPSDSQAYPKTPSYAQGILTYNETMHRRALKKQPMWIRVGTKVGKWTTWQPVTRA